MKGNAHEQDGQPRMDTGKIFGGRDSKVTRGGMRIRRGL